MVEFLVEEPSAAVVVRTIAPQLLGGVAYNVIEFQGKNDLLRKLPNRLKGYAGYLRHAKTRLVILVDRDDDDCIELKERLETMVANAGLTSLRNADRRSAPDVAIRIAVEELEAWFFGDVAALRASYGRLPASLRSRDGLRDPDAIRGGTWEALERELKRVGYFPTGLAKIRLATEVSAHMRVDDNDSASFSAFRDGVRRLITEEGAA